MSYARSIEVHSNRVRRDFRIDFHPEQGELLRHLVVTGRNGSGKSSLLEGISENLRSQEGSAGASSYRSISEELANQRLSLHALEAAPPNHPDRQNLPLVQKRVVELQRAQESFLRHRPACSVEFTHPPLFDDLYAFLPARRALKVNEVQGPTRDDYSEIVRNQRRSYSSDFLQFLVNQRTLQAFAREEGDDETASRKARWFEQLIERLRSIFEEDKLELRFRPQRFTFEVVLPDGQVRSFNELPDGYSSILAIIAEILVRQEAIRAMPSSLYGPDDDVSGIVLIDEIEAHLHLELQEQILPLLTAFFPKIQFIVTTHSPAIISSLPNAVVHDLTSQKTVLSSDLQGIRYGTLMKAHFGIDDDMDLDSTADLQRLQTLADQPTRSAEEEQAMDTLVQKLATRSHALALELWNRRLLDQINRKASG